MRLQIRREKKQQLKTSVIVQAYVDVSTSTNLHCRTFGDHLNAYINTDNTSSAIRTGLIYRRKLVCIQSGYQLLWAIPSYSHLSAIIIGFNFINFNDSKNGERFFLLCRIFCIAVLFALLIVAINLLFKL